MNVRLYEAKTTAYAKGKGLKGYLYPVIGK